MIKTIDLSNIRHININQVREEVMKRAQGAKTQLEKAVKKAQKDVNQYQQQIESKIKDLSKIGKTQVDEAITFVKSQPITNQLLEKVEPLIEKAEKRVEPLKNDLKSKEKVIKNIVGTILKRAKDVRQTLRDPLSQVQSLKDRVLKSKKAIPVKKSKKSTTKASTAKGTATKKRKTK